MNVDSWAHSPDTYDEDVDMENTPMVVEKKVQAQVPVQ